MVGFVRNLWYMAAWEAEVKGSEFLSRTLLDEPRLLFRKSDGSGYALLDDRCPHRFAPLSKGTRAGDLITCGYHGLTFDPSGRCVRNPLSATIPPRARVCSYPVLARHSIVWFWPGDPALAEPALIPPLAFLDDPHPVSRRSMRMDANYELLTDNLMDLSHAELVHRETFRTEGAITSGKYTVHDGQDGAVWSNWWMEDVPASFNPHGIAPDQHVDKWLDMCWYAPATMSLEVGLALRGSGKTSPSARRMINPHIVTPETSASSHYFYTCEATPESEAFADRVFQTEDRPMIEAVQQSMRGRDFWSMKPLILSADGGALRARERLRDLHLRESTQEACQSAG